MSATAEHKYTAEFACGVRAALTLSLSGVRCEWTPEPPSHLKGQRRRKFLQAYRAWRNECVDDFARQNGLTVVMVIDQ
jgi:hypothetical protein